MLVLQVCAEVKSACGCSAWVKALSFSTLNCKKIFWKCHWVLPQRVAIIGAVTPINFTCKRSWSLVIIGILKVKLFRILWLIDKIWRNIDFAEANKRIIITLTIIWLLEIKWGLSNGTWTVCEYLSDVNLPWYRGDLSNFFLHVFRRVNQRL